MSGGLIPANLRRQVTALGQGEPADRAVAKVVERESVLELETEPLTIVGKSRGPGHIPRNEERLLHRHQPATPLIQDIAININAKNVRALADHPRTLQSPCRCCAARLTMLGRNSQLARTARASTSGS